MTYARYAAIYEAIKYLRNNGVDVSMYARRLHDVVSRSAATVDIVSTRGRLVEMKMRDNREPRLAQKLKLERWIQDIFSRRLKAQFQALSGEYKVIKPPKKLPPPPDDKKFIEELITALFTGASEGADLVVAQTRLSVDLSIPNQHAADWAREYTYELIKGIDDTTLEIVRSTITRFVEQDNYTMGDVFYSLINDGRYTEARAHMIGVTETTRAFAQGQRIAAEELVAQFPGTELVKTWFTNNDDRVCEICAPLDGMTVPSTDDFPGGLLDPPGHVNCRCWIEYSTKVGNG